MQEGPDLNTCVSGDAPPGYRVENKYSPGHITGELNSDPTCRQQSAADDMNVFIVAPKCSDISFALGDDAFQCVVCNCFVIGVVNDKERPRNAEHRANAFFKFLGIKSISHKAGRSVVSQYRRRAKQFALAYPRRGVNSEHWRKAIEWSFYRGEEKRQDKPTARGSFPQIDIP